MLTDGYGWRLHGELALGGNVRLNGGRSRQPRPWEADSSLGEHFACHGLVIEVAELESVPLPAIFENRHDTQIGIDLR